MELPERLRRPWLLVTAAILIALLMAIVLRVEGRYWIERDRHFGVWTADTLGAQNSQLLFDPYAFTHLSHGILLFGLLTWLLPRSTFGGRFLVAMAVEAIWEVVENAPAVINRYRDVTAAQGYVGDSVVNSLGDLLACMVGFVLARYLGLWKSIALLVVVELVLLWWIRDNLILNVLMLVWPNDSLRQWQLDQ